MFVLEKRLHDFSMHVDTTPCTLGKKYHTRVLIAFMSKSEHYKTNQGSLQPNGLQL